LIRSGTADIGRKKAQKAQENNPWAWQIFPFAFFALLCG
jgi:hypothetical protein